MDSIVEQKLDGDILSNGKEYFFSFLSDRFDLATRLWVRALESRFGKKFEPIWILACKQNEHFKKENYVVINKKLKELQKSLRNSNVVYLQDYEDLNKEFSDSIFVTRLIDKLAAKQGRVFILGFTSACMNIANPKAILLGPNPRIATRFDNKIEHVKLFEKLDLPRNRVRVYNSVAEIKQKESYPYYISAAYSSGGHESTAIYAERDLDIFYAKLRDVNKYSKLLVADLITDIQLSPNVNAIVICENRIEIICISDQILRKNQYLGNVYPSKASRPVQEAITKTTKIVGNYLSTLGFRGLFGLDFIVDSKDNMYTVDLNPRRQGGYLCNVLMSKRLSIIDLELKLALGEPLPDFKFEDFQPNFAWAHSKIKPYYSNMRIKNTVLQGDPQRPFDMNGTTFRCIFYPRNYLLLDGNAGYYIASGKTPEEVKDRVIQETEIIISRSFELYDGD